MMICPCGHAGPLPELTGRYACVSCKQVLEFHWFGAPDAFRQWQCWRIRSGEVMRKGEKVRVEFVKETV